DRECLPQGPPSKGCHSKVPCEVEGFWCTRGRCRTPVPARLVSFWHDLAGRKENRMGSHRRCGGPWPGAPCQNADALELPARRAESSGVSARTPLGFATINATIGTTRVRLIPVTVRPV